MTVIIALKDMINDKILVGYDGQGTSEDISLPFGEKLVTMSIPVVNEENEIINDTEMHILVSGSHYIKSYLTHAFTPPGILEDEDVVDYLYNQFFQSLSNELTNHGLLKNEDGALESQAGLIIIYDNRLFNVYSDFSIVESTDVFTCNGSGWKISTSVLSNLLEFHHDMELEDMIEEALLTTARLNIYCNDDITIKTIE